MKKILIIYHGDCWDGFGGAYAAWKKFGNRADYLGLKRGVAVPVKKIKSKEVYVIDYDLRDEASMKALINQNKKVVALDHHVTGEKYTKMAHEYRYALNHSGAVLAWRYFYPQKPMPWLLKRVEDFDIWNLKLSFTKEIVAYMDMMPHDFKLWDKIVHQLENPKTRKIIIDKGKLLRAYEEKIINDAADKAMLVKFQGYKTLAVNFPILRDQIGEKLYKKVPPISISWRVKEDAIVVSLRSNGTVDVAKIAEKYGGGGHRASAGFAIDPDKKLPWTRINVKTQIHK